MRGLGGTGLKGDVEQPKPQGSQPHTSWFSFSFPSCFVVQAFEPSLRQMKGFLHTQQV